MDPQRQRVKLLWRNLRHVKLSSLGQSPSGVCLQKSQTSVRSGSTVHAAFDIGHKRRAAYFSGSWSKVCLQPAQQKKKDWSWYSDLCLASAGFTIIPQTGSRACTVTTGCFVDSCWLFWVLLAARG